MMSGIANEMENVFRPSIRISLGFVCERARTSESVMCFPDEITIRESLATNIWRKSGCEIFKLLKVWSDLDTFVAAIST